MNTLHMIIDARAKYATVRLDHPQFVVMDRRTYLLLDYQLHREGFLPWGTHADIVVGLRIVVRPTSETFHLEVAGAPHEESVR